MAQKRKAQEAFGKPNGQLSAVAAAKLARQSAGVDNATSKLTRTDDAQALASVVAEEPYEDAETALRTPNSTSDYVVPDPEPEVEPASTRLSNFQPRKANILKDDDTCLYVLLKSNETLAFVGIYDLEVLTGVITVYASVLQASSGTRRVYAPSTNALPIIHARQDKTEIRIRSVNNGPQKLEKMSPLFRNLWSSSGDMRSFARIGTIDEDASQRLLSAVDITRDVDVVLRTLSAKMSVESRKPRVMAVGAKSSGKSTFNRILCNHLLSWTEAKKISYLDLDPGQPEFGPPGQVSLTETSSHILGPAFTHPASIGSSEHRMVRNHTIAATTFKENYDLYLACASDLASHAKSNQGMIVNSCGWVSGLGAAALTDLVAALDITDIVVFDPLDPRLVESLETSSSQKPKVHHVQRQAPHPSPRTPAETRAMQTMSYMHHRQPHKSDRKWSGKSLSETRAWEVRYAGANPGIAAIASYGQSPHAEFLAEVLDGSIVAIVAVDSEAGDDDVFLPSSFNGAALSALSFDEAVARTPEELPYLVTTSEGTNLALNPANSHCVGLALVRGIDVANKSLQLCTPLSELEIAGLNSKRIVLVRGSFDAPEWAYLEDLHKHGDKGSEERPWVSRKTMAGIEGAVWRMRHPPMAGNVNPNR